jgi:transketolase
LETEKIMREFTFATTAEFDRVRTCNASAVQRAQLFATLARLNALSMIACAGSGHIGSSFSCLDIVSWLFLNEMRLPATPDRKEERDIFFSSKGHDVPGLYAVMIGMGQLPESQLTKLRRLGGLPGHPDVELTPFIEANTGSLGMGISKAKGMVFANRLRGRTARIFVLTGDGELQEGQIWESLAGAANRKLGEITVIVDHNKIQSDTYVAVTSDLGDLEAKFSAFGWHVQRCDGHDLAALEAAIAEAGRETDRPSVIIADTVKGQGVSFMRHTAMQTEWYRYHSGAPSPDDYRSAMEELTRAANEGAAAIGLPEFGFRIVREELPAPPAQEAQRMVRGYSEALMSIAARREDIVALDADLVLDTGLIPFRETYPDRFLECGIAEQDMVSQASGLALSGLLPVVHSFACFLTPRANEQIYNAASEQRRIIYVGSLAGLVPAGPGHSHQSVRDIALMGSLPGLAAFEPSCEKEAGMAITWAVDENPGSTYLRLISIPCIVPFDLPANYRPVRGRGVTLTEGRDVVIFAYGPVMLAQAVIAARQAQGSIGIKVVNMPWLNTFDDVWLKDVVSGARAVITVDNHLLDGGQGERIAARLAAMRDMPPVTRLGITGIPACGRNDEVLRHHGLDAEGLLAAVTACLN